jgi:hypothetical protein
LVVVGAGFLVGGDVVTGGGGVVVVVGFSATVKSTVRVPPTLQ